MIFSVPRQLHEIATVIGLSAVLELARNFGGQLVYVPKQIDHDHEISKVIGSEAAEKLAEYYFQTAIDFPVGLKREIIISEMLARRPKATTNEMVRETGLSRSGLYRMIKRMEKAQGRSLRGNADQFDLFDAA
jgi:Mor family transcriptional regulator